MENQIVAFDAGGDTLKASILSRTTSKKALNEYKIQSPCYTLSNRLATSSNTSVLIGKDLIENEKTGTKLHHLRPIQRGYCVNWNAENEIYSHFFSNVMKIAPSETSLVTTCPYFMPPVLCEMMNQVIFEELNFQSYTRVSSNEMVSYALPEPCNQSPCQLIVDSGFSFTHITPIYNHKSTFPSSIKRINVGGKILTNYLKELVSYREVNVMEDKHTKEITRMKETLCYCAQDFQKEMELLHEKKMPWKYWVLPDYAHTLQGYQVSESEMKTMEMKDLPVVKIGLEQIAIPEVLFHPSDVGLQQMGIAETICNVVKSCPVELQSILYENIILVGGNTLFSGFSQRLHQELRPFVDMKYSIGIYPTKNPIYTALEGCTAFAQTKECEKRIVTKQEYAEHGSNICHERFKLP